MNDTPESNQSRRDFLKDAGIVAATSTLAAASHVHAGGSDTIQVALVGCGGRGIGAVANALSTKKGSTKLVAMADVFNARMDASYKLLTRTTRIKRDQVDVPAERRFLGFDGFKKAMDCLKPGDLVILATPPAFRWVHFSYAIEKGLHVFMEKPLTVDGPTSRKMFKLGEESIKKKLKVGAGMMCRHSEAREDLFDRIKSGAIGDIDFMRSYRMSGPAGYFSSKPKPDDISDLLYQVQRFHSFLWASGGCFGDFVIHHIDECCWMKDAWPVHAQGSGGRHFRGDSIDQNFDTYSVEYTFADGARLFVEDRNMNGCRQEFASYAHGTKGSAVISEGGHYPANCRTYKSNDMTTKPVWAYSGTEPNPYQLEMDRLIAAIRNDRPFNEVKNGTEASLITSMGRMAAHSGRVITRQQILECTHEFAPTVDRLTMDSPAPLQPGRDGKYPVPHPGVTVNREY